MTPQFDQVRAFILAESQKDSGKKGLLKEWSLAIDRNHAYLHQFIHNGTPVKLPEDAREALAKVMQVPESKLKEPRRRVVAPGEEFDPDPGEPIETADKKPFGDAIPQTTGLVGGGSVGHSLMVGNNEVVEDWWRIPPSVLAGARSVSTQTVGFPMGGDSMEPTIQRTDIVFIDKRRISIEPDGIWAVDYGLGRVLKRVFIRRAKGGARYVLRSDNRAYPDEEYSPDEVTVIGRYVGRFSVF